MSSISMIKSMDEEKRERESDRSEQRYSHAPRATECDPSHILLILWQLLPETSCSELLHVLCVHNSIVLSSAVSFQAIVGDYFLCV